MNRRAILLAALALSATGAAAATPPPVYDFCGAAVAVVVDSEGHAAYTGDTCDGENLVLDHTCQPSATHNGCEDYYAIPVPMGSSFRAEVTHAGDAVLMVSAECRVEGTMFTCLESADEFGPGGTESIRHASWFDDRTFYLVVDSHTTAGCGAYTLDLSIQSEVGAERASFGGIKAAYR
ncbi:MAG: hypothetical protein Q7W29_10115 [bacterium]|nr:hypothetical protein [bacterium]